ncbi:glycerate kinase [Lepisosteus oculatus]|uniref:glycerate kinase n=1 Tax=Lepisosteus oculatus TaxID=7918 RepID=UPI00371810A6
MGPALALAPALSLSLSLGPGAPRAMSRAMSRAAQAREIFGAAVGAVQPDAVVRRSLERQGERLLVGGRSYTLRENLHLVGFGKAVLGMAAAAERIVGDHLVQGVISVPLGIQEALRQDGKGEMLLGAGSRIRALEGARHNLPDAAAQEAARAIRALAGGLTDRDLLLVLISGGGSALLPSPVPPVTLEEKQGLTRMLAARGATIQELNTVRKALSLLKGGGLARCAHPAQVVSLILSDVIGDPLDLIASGPTVPGPARPEASRAILERYGLWASLPRSVRDVLESQQQQEEEEGGPGRVHNVLIGSNTLALEAAARRAQELGFRPVVVSPGVCGDVRAVARLYATLARFAREARGPGGPPPGLAAAVLELAPQVGVAAGDLRRALQAAEGGGPGLCLLAGGEPTVELRGGGRGGRNQELALRVGLELGQGAAFLSGGTDGQDGPTDAAGAVADAQLAREARAQGLDPEGFLRDNDSFTFFSRLSGGRRLLRTGLTGTNVMDVHVLLLPAS